MQVHFDHILGFPLLIFIMEVLINVFLGTYPFSRRHFNTFNTARHIGLYLLRTVYIYTHTHIYTLFLHSFSQQKRSVYKSVADVTLQRGNEISPAFLALIVELRYLNPSSQSKPPFYCLMRSSVLFHWTT